MDKIKAFLSGTKKPMMFMAILPLVFFYYEILFRLFTTDSFFHLGTFCTALFSFAYGAVLYILITVFKNTKVINVLTAVFLGILAVPYLIEYFVYRQFKEFYDLNTIFGGAGDAITGYTKETLALIFSLDGLLKIVLYFLPLALYLIFSKHLVSAMLSGAKRRITAAIGAAVCYALSIVLVLTNSVLMPLFSSQYNFQSAMQRFGLVTSVGLELKKFALGSYDEGFEGIETQVSSVAQTEISSVAQTESSSAPQIETSSVIKTETSSVSETEETQKPPKPPIDSVFNRLELNLSSGTGKIKELNSYISSLPASKKNEYTGLFKGKNLIFITAEAFTAELINPQLTPTLYRLANSGIQFTDYYQPASSGTTGGEYQNIFGMLPSAGGMSFKNTADHYNFMTIGSQLDRLGYYGKAYHNNSYKYYSRHLTHTNLGYSDGFMGYGNGMEKYVKSMWPQSDREMIEGTLPTYIDKQPFNIYYMSVSGHSGYTRTGNSMTSRHWNRVQHLPYSDAVKGYFAANLDLEDALSHLVSELENKGIADDTVICISADHFPYGLDSGGSLGNMPLLSELYGYNVENYFQRDHSRLILWCGCLEKSEPIVVDTPTFSLDILPTLSNLFGTEFDSRLFPGRDVFSDAQPLVFNTHYDWKTAYGTYFASTGKFVLSEGVESVPENYVQNIKTQVRNKMRYCNLALQSDYFRHLFEKK